MDLSLVDKVSKMDTMEKENCLWGLQKAVKRINT